MFVENVKISHRIRLHSRSASFPEIKNTIVFFLFILLAESCPKTNLYPQGPPGTAGVIRTDTTTLADVPRLRYRHHMFPNGDIFESNISLVMRRIVLNVTQQLPVATFREGWSNFLPHRQASRRIHRPDSGLSNGNLLEGYPSGRFHRLPFRAEWIFHRDSAPPIGGSILPDGPDFVLVTTNTDQRLITGHMLPTSSLKEK